MFHLMLILPALAAYAFVLLIPFCVGGGLQLVLTICCKRKRFLLIPTFLGIAGLIFSLFTRNDVLTVGDVLIYWGVYALCILVVFGIVWAIKRAVLRKIDATVKEYAEKKGSGL